MVTFSCLLLLHDGKKDHNNQRSQICQDQMTCFVQLVLDYSCCNVFISKNFKRNIWNIVDTYLRTALCFSSYIRAIFENMFYMIVNSPLVQCASLWLFSLFHMYLSRGSRTARSGASGCVCGDVSSRWTLSVHREKLASLLPDSLPVGAHFHSLRYSLTGTIPCPWLPQRRVQMLGKS